MNDAEVDLLTDSGNFAVVHLRGRQFPGVVFQGDTLHSMIASLKDLRAKLLHDACEPELNDLIEQLEKVLSKYKSVCNSRGLPLPFSE